MDAATTPEPWQRVCRDGWLPLLSAGQLSGLRDALASDDPRLVQGVTTDPLPVAGVLDWPCAAGCLVAWGEWQGEDDVTVLAVNVAFACACARIDGRLNEVGGCRHLFDFWDATPRAEALAGLLAEVKAEVQRRAAPCQSA